MNPVGFDDSDEDVNVMTSWAMTSEDEGDEKSIASKSSICEVSDAGSLNRSAQLVVFFVFVDRSFGFR
jgi:hypothetical protein